MKLSLKHKLLITIVKKKQAKTIVKAAKEAGAEGATVLLGKGSGIHENKKFLGIPVEYEKEVVLTIAKANVMEEITDAIVKEGKLNQSGKGIGILIDLKKVIGIFHLQLEEGNEEGATDKEVDETMGQQDTRFDLIVTIVNKGDASKVVDATKNAGAEGGTVLTGRGSGIHEQAKILNIQIEPEKEIVLTLIHHNRTKNVIEAIEEEVQLNQSGKGIAFVLDVERVVGINHVIEEIRNEEGR